MIVLASLVETADGIVKTFGIDWPMLIAQAINFLIVALVIWKFAFKIFSPRSRNGKQIELGNADKIKLELEENEKQQQETSAVSCRKAISSTKNNKTFIESQKEDARKQAEEIFLCVSCYGAGERAGLKAVKDRCLGRSYDIKGTFKDLSQKKRKGSQSCLEELNLVS